MAVAAHAHVVVEGAGEEGVHFVVANSGAQFLCARQGSTQGYGFIVHVAKGAVDHPVDVEHGGVLHKSHEEVHELGVVGTEVEEAGAEFVAALCNGLWKLRDRGVKKHLVEAVQCDRFDRCLFAA